MGIRTDILTVLRGGKPERVPWTIYAAQLFRGHTERTLRNKRLGILTGRPICQESTPNVEVVTRTVRENGKQFLRRTYHTPVGSVWEKLATNPSYYNEGLVRPWIVEYMIKDLADYNVVRFMVEDTVYQEDHEGFEKTQKRLGEDGLVLARMGRCPLQRLLIDLAGLQRIAFDLYDHPGTVESLMQVMEQKQNEVYCIGVQSPAELIISPDNISTTRTSPDWFERYVLPFYNRHGKMVREAGKLYMAHMDGTLKEIKDLIARCDLDVIEAFTPPPMGNLPLKDAQAAWPDKAIWCNFPETLFLGDEATVYGTTLQLMRQVYDNGGFVLGITEDFPEDPMKDSLFAMARAIATYENG